VKIGDLIRDPADGEIGIVLTEPRSYSSYVKKGSVQFVMVHWPSAGMPVKMDMDAVKNGWVEVVSTE